MRSKVSNLGGILVRLSILIVVDTAIIVVAARKFVNVYFIDFNI